MNFQKTNYPGFFKDKKTGFVLNTNVKDLKAYKSEVRRVKRMRSLEEEMAEMKALVQQLLKEKT